MKNKATILGLTLLSAISAVSGAENKPVVPEEQKAKKDAAAFVLPVSASAFDIQSRELLEMGERSLVNQDWAGALSRFYELHGKVVKESGEGTNDAVLSSALLAEACLAFLPGTEIKLAAPVDRVVNVTSVAAEQMSKRPGATVSEDVQVFWSYIRVRFLLKQNQVDEAENELRTLWRLDEKSADRLTRLGDMHNWILLTMMQLWAAKAEAASTPEKSLQAWKTVLEYSKAYAPKLTIKKRVIDATASITAKAGESLQRHTRKDVSKSEIDRLVVYGLLAEEKWEDALAILKQTNMAVFGEERTMQQLICHAGLTQVDDAAELIERAGISEYYLGKTVPPALQKLWHRMLWAFVDMYYRSGDYSGTEEYLAYLGKILTENERGRWLQLRLATLETQLEAMCASDKALDAARLEQLHNATLDLSILYPDACNATWKSFIGKLQGAEKTAYLEAMARILFLLGKAEQKAANTNSALEIYGTIGKCEVLPDSLRYRAYNAIGNAIHDERAIEAYKACTHLNTLTDAQKADSLLQAARCAQAIVCKDASLAADIKKRVETEMIALYTQVFTRYPKTLQGVEAHFQLAEYLYDAGRFKEAMPEYMAYWKNPEHNPDKAPHAALRWCRCVRQLLESKESASQLAADSSKQAVALLKELREAKGNSELNDQAYIESYRFAQVLNTPVEESLKWLEIAIVRQKDNNQATNVFWTALYERMLYSYRRGDFSTALSYGELFRKRDIAVGGTRSPWRVESLLLLGDIYSAALNWHEAYHVYSDVAQEKTLTGKKHFYAQYESAYASYMGGNFDNAIALARTAYAEAIAAKELSYAYQNAILAGDALRRKGDYLTAAKEYALAQTVYGSDDRFKTSLAKCFQGEMLLMMAESLFNANSNGTQQEAIGHLEKAAIIFRNLLETSGDDGANWKEQAFDLFIRAQYCLGACYEVEMTVAGLPPELVEKARTNALDCYQRIGDYFMMRYRNGQPLKGTEYFVKGLDRRVRLLTSGINPVSADTMETVARLYEEYAKMNIEGSVIARKRAEQIRKTWK